MRTPTRVLLSVGVACVLSVLTGSLLLNGNVGAAIWMEGPYFPLTLLLPGSVDKLATMLVAVALYYFICSLVALKHRSRRAVLVVVLVVIAVNSLGSWAWHRSTAARADASGQAMQLQKSP